MTNKEQIIIDGVDVSECKCLHNVKVILEIAKPEDFEILCGATNGAIKCEKWKDCYFKQLARKTQKCEELKKANIHIDNNRKCKAKKLKEIEQLLIDCSSGYTDEVMQKIMEIIHKPETVCFENKYEQALDSIVATIKDLENENIVTFPDFSLKENCKIIMGQCNKGYVDILDIINKAKDGQ